MDLVVVDNDIFVLVVEIGVARHAHIYVPSKPTDASLEVCVHDVAADL